MTIKRTRIRNLAAVGAGVALVATMSTGAALAQGSPKKAYKANPDDLYYLALGDSLSVGWQAPGEVTKHGYDADLYAYYKKTITGLKLEDLGCPGETTSTMINGGCSGGVNYSEGNQLAQAEYFIKNYKVAFITIDIGANDVDGCAPYVTSKNSVTDASDPDAFTDTQNCVENGVTPSTVGADGYPASDYGITSDVEGIAGMNTDLATIIPGLQAADTQGAPIYAMNLYDPFLALYLIGSIEDNPTDETLAEQSVTLADGLNTDFSTVFGGYDIPVANVSGIFGTDNTSTSWSYPPPAAGLDTLTSDPHNVHAVCELTWECTTYENIHANDAGYEAIAIAFEQVIGGLPG